MKKNLVVCALVFVLLFLAVTAFATNTTITYEGFIDSVNLFLKECESYDLTKFLFPELTSYPFLEGVIEPFEFRYSGTNPFWILTVRVDPTSHQLMQVKVINREDGGASFAQKHILDIILLFSLSGADDPNDWAAYMSKEKFEYINGYGRAFSTFFSQSELHTSTIWDLNALPRERTQIAFPVEAVLYSGDYIVGQHIASGEYSVKAEKYAYFGVTRGGKPYKSEALGPTNIIGRIVLQAGDEVEISGGTVELTPFK